MSLIFFNLLVNAIFSLLLGLGLVYFFVWFFRIETGHWKVFLLSLPFLKIVFDCLAGVPQKSVLLSGVDPFTLPPRSQFLTIGMGLTGWFPSISVLFSLRDLEGRLYTASIGDYLVIWLQRHTGREVPVWIVSLVLMISAFLLLRRLYRYVKFEFQRRRDRQELAVFRSLTAGLRHVDVYISSTFSGSPFTGGVYRPYICLPQNAVESLEPAELEAVLAHEMGHIRYFDILVTLMIQILGDLFWFVPGYHWLSRKIDNLREIVADRAAVNSGIDADFLASSLLKLQEIPSGDERAVLYSAFFREKSLLKERVQRLLGQRVEKPPRWGWQYLGVRIGVTIFVMTLVMNSILGGNYADLQLRDFPDWMNNWMKKIFGP